MQRRALSLAALVLFSVVSCSDDQPAAEAPSAAPAGTEQKVAKIPLLPGYKYYAGGPVMKRDAYGSYRLHRFDGEVEQPPSRGMVFGAKREGDKLEYRVWANGKLIAVHRGTFREGDVFWQDYAESYVNEKMTARERDEHLDDQKRTKVVLEDIDPATGEVIRVTESLRSYLPPKVEDAGGADDDTEDAAGGAPAEAAPAGETQAPAAARP